MAPEFNPFIDLKSQDPNRLYSELRNHARVQWSPEADLFTVSRYEDVLAVLKDGETYSSEAMRTVLTAGMMLPLTPRYVAKLLSFLFKTRINPLAVLKVGNLISLDGERHNELRKIVGRGFTPRRIADWNTRVHAIVEEHVAKIRKRDEIDIVADLAVPLPTTIIAEMLGVEPERRDDFKRWSGSIINVASGAAANDFLNSGIFEDLSDLFRYLQGVIRKRRKNPCEDLISLLVDPRQDAVLAELDVIQFIVLLLVAGNETTTNVIGNAVSALLDNPKQLDRVIDDPSLVENLVEETLRFDPPLPVAFRNTTCNTELGGVAIPKGATLAILIGCANRDERRFDDPDQFNIERDASAHLGFGFGMHFCLGSSLARLQARTALSALIPELKNFRRTGAQSQYIDSFLVRGRRSIELSR